MEYQVEAFVKFNTNFFPARCAVCEPLWKEWNKTHPKPNQERPERRRHTSREAEEDEDRTSREAEEDEDFAQEGPPAAPVYGEPR